MERELVLLGLLRREDMHGYRLNEFIERDLSFCTDIKKPTAYYLLDKLNEQDYITETDDVGDDSGRPPRTTYRITSQGEDVFMDLLRENLRTYQPPTFAGDIGIAFMDALPHAESRALLAERREQMRQRLAELEGTPRHNGSLNLVIEHHITHIQSELEWIERVLASLTASPSTEDNLND